MNYEEKFMADVKAAGSLAKPWEDPEPILNLQIGLPATFSVGDRVHVHVIVRKLR